MRFAGELNVDLNEITTNLVPFPRLHYLMPALAPLDGGRGVHGGSGGAGGGGVDARQRPRAAVVRQLFMDAFSRSNQLIRADPRQGTNRSWQFRMSGLDIQRRRLTYAIITL